MGSSVDPDILKRIIAQSGVLKQYQQPVDESSESNSDRGIIDVTLDYMDRPYSAIMGSLNALQQGTPSEHIGENLRKALSGEKHFGAYDVLVDAGADPESNVTKIAGLGLDIINPVDPMSYVTLGLGKTSKIAKVAGKADDIMRVTKAGRKVLSRTKAAEEGAWAALRMFDKAVTPKVVNKVVAKPLDWIAETVGDSRVVRTAAQHFGGVRKFEKQFPGIGDEMRKLAQAKHQDQQTFAIGMAEFQKRFGEEAMPIVTNYLEEHGDEVAAVTRRIAGLVDTSDQVKGNVFDAVGNSELISDIEYLDNLKKGAGLSDEHWDAVTHIAPVLADIKDSYEGVLKKLDPDFEFPIKNYLKHFMPNGMSERHLKDAADVLGQDAIERLSNKALDYSNPQFMARKYRDTIERINKIMELRGKPLRFEDDAAVIVNEMFRDAERFRYQYGIKNLAKTKFGKQFAGMTEAKAAGYVPLEMDMPIAVDKNPFTGWYVPREVDSIMRGQAGLFNQVQSQGFFHSMAELLGKTNRIFKAHTLAYWLEFHVRNIASDGILASQGGLSPIKDLFVEASRGRSSYLASLGFAGRKGRVPLPGNQELKSAQKHLDNIISDLKARFGEEVSFDMLDDYMTRERVTDTMALRDIDIADVVTDPDRLAAARDGRIKGGIKSVLKNVRSATKILDIDNNVLVQKGFALGGEIQDMPRVALFLNSMKDAAKVPNLNLQDALEYARANVSKHLLDYTDLTPTERQIKNTFIPFYTWTAKNLPKQLETLVTNPGKFAYLARAYNGAWNAYDGEYEQDDMPKWLQESYGIPVRKIKDEKGNVSYAVWNTESWIPNTDLNVFADLLRGNLKSVILSRLSPAIKEPIEQLYNTDAFFGRAIDEGQTETIFGVPAPPRVAHVFRNIRLVTAMERLNPFGIVDEVGKLFNRWEDKGPRNLPSGTERAMGFLTGLKFYGRDPKKDALYKQSSIKRDISSAKSKMRYAIRTGQTAEAKNRREEILDLNKQLRDLAKGYSERERRRKALSVRDTNTKQGSR